MKTAFTQSLMVVSTLFFSPIALASIFTSPIPDGAYRGRFVGMDSGRVEFLTQSIRQCEGCFVAILFKNQRHDKRIEAFRAIPAEDIITQQDKGNGSALKTSAVYDLIPFGVDVDGEITTPDDNPSLVLTVQKYAGTKDVEFSISNAGSTNNKGTQTSMEFTGGASTLDIDDGEAGRYKVPMKVRAKGSINIISTNPQDGSRFASATIIKDRDIAGGIYSLKEKAPGVFTFSVVSHLATGVETKQYPEKIVIFMKRLNRERAYLINPNDSSDISLLKIK